MLTRILLAPCRGSSCAYIYAYIHMYVCATRRFNAVLAKFLLVCVSVYMYIYIYMRNTRTYALRRLDEILQHV